MALRGPHGDYSKLQEPGTIRPRCTSATADVTNKPDHRTEHDDGIAEVTNGDYAFCVTAAPGSGWKSGPRWYQARRRGKAYWKSPFAAEAVGLTVCRVTWWHVKAVPGRKDRHGRCITLARAWACCAPVHPSTGRCQLRRQRQRAKLVGNVQPKKLEAQARDAIRHQRAGG